MKFIRQIITFVLTLAVFSIGAGADVVHICSHYCKTQMCTSEAHSHQDDCCCKSDYTASNDGETRVSGKCTCIDVTCDIDYYKANQEDDFDIRLIACAPLQDFLTFTPLNESISLIHTQAPNAPPVTTDGRTLLTLHSTLII